VDLEGPVWRPCGRVLKSAAGLRQVRVLSACCLLPAAFLIMTFADLEHNDKLLAKEKLEWVTPKISLMEGEATTEIEV